MRARTDAATLLERTLIGDARRVGFTLEVTAAKATRWASVTFVGARHRLEVAGPDNAEACGWLDGLSEADLPLRGHLVADAVVVEQARADGRFAATIEVLTVEEA